MAETLGRYIHKNLNSFFQDGKGSFKERDPRGTLLILDRSYDISPMFVHDFYYQSLIYDFFNIEDGEICLEIEGKDEKS
jgi:hypothetical protein